MGKQYFIFISYTTSTNAKTSSGLPSRWVLDTCSTTPTHPPQLWRNPILDHTAPLHHENFSVHDLGLDWVRRNPKLYLMLSHSELPSEQQGCSSYGIQPRYENIQDWLPRIELSTAWKLPKIHWANSESLGQALAWGSVQRSIGRGIEKRK